GQAPVERFAQARLLGESPDHIAWTTPASAVAYAGQALQLTVQQDAQLSAGQTLSAVSGQHTALFAQRGPIKLIAAAGPVSLQAHTGALELLADQAVTVTATDTRIDVLAQHKIVLQAGQTRITLEGGDITFACPGQFTVKASMHPFLGGEMNAVAIPPLPEERLPLQTLSLDHRYHDDQGLAGADYVVTLADGGKRHGTLDAQGRAEVANVPGGSAEVVFSPMPGLFGRKDMTPTPDHAANPADAKLDGVVDKYLAAATADSVKADPVKGVQ
ncbi:type VI secretion system tip protein VgrG, partial [Xanthomonas oryzae pv. oryzae]